MSITHIQVLSMPVSDQQAAKRFYTETLGLELVRDNPMGNEARWVEVAPAGAATSIVRCLGHRGAMKHLLEKVSLQPLLNWSARSGMRRHVV